MRQDICQGEAKWLFQDLCLALAGHLMIEELPQPGYLKRAKPLSVFPWINAIPGPGMYEGVQPEALEVFVIADEGEGV